jgi:hypothetical protein
MVRLSAAQSKRALGPPRRGPGALVSRAGVRDVPVIAWKTSSNPPPDRWVGVVVRPAENLIRLEWTGVGGAERCEEVGRKTWGLRALGALRRYLR